MRTNMSYDAGETITHPQTLEEYTVRSRSRRGDGYLIVDGNGTERKLEIIGDEYSSSLGMLEEQLRQSYDRINKALGRDYDVFKVGERELAIVGNYVEGNNLAGDVANISYTEEEAIDFMLEMVDDYVKPLHKNGIRDVEINPENVTVVRNGEDKSYFMNDFGLLTDENPRGSLTSLADTVVYITCRERAETILSPSLKKILAKMKGEDERYSNFDDLMADLYALKTGRTREETSPRTGRDNFQMWTDFDKPTRTSKERKGGSAFLQKMVDKEHVISLRNPKRQEAFDELLDESVEKHFKNSELRRLLGFASTYTKTFVIPTGIGAALGYFSTGNIQGALEGMKTGMWTGGTIVAFDTLFLYGTLKGRNREDSKQRLRDSMEFDAKTAMNAYERPGGVVKSCISFGLVFPTICTIGTLVTEVLTGIPISQWGVMKIAGTYGVLKGAKEFFKGKKWSGKILNKVDEKKDAGLEELL